MGWKVVFGSITGNAAYPTAGGYNMRAADIGLTSIYGVLAGIGVTGSQVYHGRWNSDRMAFYGTSVEAADNEVGVDGIVVRFIAVGW